MTSHENDFDAAKAVVDQLKGLDKERQQRVLRWVAESLNLQLAPSAPADHTTREAGRGVAADEQVRGQAPLHQTQKRAADIKSFADSKQPKSDVQFATVVAYYYRFEAAPENRQDSINAQTLQEAARLAGRRRPPDPKTTLNNAKRLGYLDSADRGQFRINSVGENLVAMTLPGVPGAENTSPRQRSRRTLKGKKR